MYSFNSNPSSESDPQLESNSIWNSAGLTADFNPNLPNLPNNPLQHFQTFAQLNNLTPLPVSSSEPKLPTKFSGFEPQQRNEPDNQAAAQLAASLMSQFSTELMNNAGGNPIVGSAAAGPAVPPNIGAPPLFTPDAANQNVPSVSPTPTTNKDPGYFSESECSSNSSEKDNLSASFAKLHVDPYTGLTIPVKSPASSKPSLESIPTAESSPTSSNVLSEDIINALTRYDAQSFDPQDFQFAGDESWKIIKKPGMGKEAEIVPDISSPESAPYVPSEGSWSGASSPSIGSSWSAESAKPSFVQSTKQQVCVFCRNNGEDASVYTTHTLMSTAGKVICPILFAYKCPICHATGDYAHTLKYCPMMPKGISTSTTQAPPPSATRPTNLARLPKTATFPKHLSSSAKAAMSMGPTSSIAKSSFLPSRSRASRPFPPAQQIQQLQHNNPGGQDYIAELREAAEKIITFANQIEQNQPQGNQMNQRNAPQVAQFLLKLDKNKPAPFQNFNSSESGNRSMFGAPKQNTNMDPDIAMKLMELLTASSNAPTGQGYQPFPNSPPQFNNPQDSDQGAAFNAKLQELLNNNNNNNNNNNYNNFNNNSQPDFSSYMGQENTSRYKVPPTTPSQNFLQMRSQSTSSPSSSSHFSPSFNVSAPTFVPNFGNPGVPEMERDGNDASAEIFKMLGINKAPGGGVNMPPEEPTATETDKENTLANILANIMEYQNRNNG